MLPSLALTADVRYVATHVRMMTLIPGLRPELAHLFGNPNATVTPTNTSVLAAWGRITAAAPATTTLIDWDLPDARPGLGARMQKLVNAAEATALDD